MTGFANLFSAQDDPRSVAPKPSGPPPSPRRRPDRRRTDLELFGHAKRELLPSLLPQTSLKLENGIPSHDTVSRLLGMLDPAAFPQWTGKPCAVLTTDRAQQRSPPHPVSGWC